MLTFSLSFDPAQKEYFLGFICKLAGIHIPQNLFKPTMNRLNIKVDNDVTLSTIVFGSLPINFLLVHGLASNALLWNGVGQFLIDQGFSSNAVDLRGHGLSSKPSHGYTHEDITRDLAKVAQHVMSPESTVVLVGQSWGASLVVDFALRYPNVAKGLVLVDGGYFDLKSRFTTWQECEERLRPPDFSGVSFATATKFIATQHPTWSQDAVSATLANLEELGDHTVRARLSLTNHLAILRELYNFTPLDSISRLTIPTRILVAKQEIDLSPDSRKEVDELRNLKHVRFDFFANADHDLHAQMPEEVAQIALDVYEQAQVVA